MELNYDWRGFQAVFNPRKKTALPDPGESVASIYAVVDHERVVTAFSRGEDLLDWSGVEFKEMLDEHSHREFIVFEREKVDKLMSEVVGLSHFYSQLDHLVTLAAPQLYSKGQLLKSPKGL